MEQSLYFFFFLVPDKQWGARGRSIIFGFICTYFRGVVLIKYVFLNITPKKLHEIKNILIFVAD